MARPARNRIWTPPPRDRYATPERGAVPGWIASFCLHGLLLLACATGLRSCQSGVSGAGDDHVRQVGIFVRDAQDDRENNVDEAPEQAVPNDTQHTETMPSEAEVAAQAVPDLEQLPADLLDLPPNDLPNVLGAGAPTGLPGSLPPIDAATGLEGAPPPARMQTGGGSGETSFFEIKARGTRFAYVVDHSGSMGFYNQLRVAKAEVLTSIESLDSTQEFQIIFYNTRYSEFSLRNRPPGLAFATDINRTLAAQYVRSVQPDGGTDHMPAIRKALSYRPEHLFLLTDADQPQLSANDLNEIRKLNGGRTRIHCIEFGRDGDLGIDNFLKRLARQNEGSYRYRDVRQFQ